MLAEPAKAWGLRCVASGQVLATRVEGAFDSASRKKGLLGRDGLPDGHALVIAPCGGVHTFFMRFPIDVVFLARDGRVLKVCSAVKPWRMAFAPTAFGVVELPAGTARRCEARKGDYVALVETPPIAGDGLPRP